MFGIQGREHSDSPDFDAGDLANVAATQAWREHMEAQFATKRVDEWMALFEAARVPVARVNFPEEMSDDPQANADGMFLELEHTITGWQKVVGPIVTMSATPTGSTLPAPSLGEHTGAILRELGFGDEAISRLRADGVIRCLD